MEISFESGYSGLLMVLAFVLAIGVSYFIYFRGADHKVLTVFQKFFLAALRSLVLFLALVLLLSPILERSVRIKQLPVLAIAFDNSRSVKSYLSSNKKLSEELKDRFSNDYQLDFLTFGEKVKNTDSLTGTERRSDYGQLLKSVKSSYFNKNMGALLIVGDGIYNQGQDPVNIASGLRFPVYILGIGDTTRKVDASIRNVKTNKVAFLKNRFPVEIELNFSKLKNKIAYIDIEHNKQSVYSSSLAITSDDEFKLEFVNLEATEVGMQHYKIKIRQFDGEVNSANNEYEFVIQVLENKQRILMLSDGPHPDMGAIRSSLAELQNYDVNVVTGDTSPDSLNSYSLIIFNQIPSVRNAASTLLGRVKASRVPVLFIIGHESMIDQINSLDIGLKISASNNYEEVQAEFDSNFGLFTLSEETKDLLKLSPPLLSPFGNTDIVPSLQPLALQNIRNISTNKVLWALGTDKGRKTGFIVGEGIWRWRLDNFKVNGNRDAFNELIQKTIQYLALKENEDNFNVYHPALFQETDPVEFTAELYNDSYQLVNTPDVSMKIQNSDHQEFTYIFDRKDDYYSLNVGNLAPGDYSFIAEAQLGNQLFSEKGNFSVIKNELEIQNSQADFGVLYRIAQQTGGKFAVFDKYDAIIDSIQNNRDISVRKLKQSVQTEWINLKLLFSILILLLGIEWFCRKYWGIY